MLKKVIIFVFLGLVVGCAPIINLSTSVRLSWASEIFYSSQNDRDIACETGYQAGRNAKKDAGKIMISSPQGDLSFRSTLGYLYSLCAFFTFTSSPKPQAVDFGYALQVRSLAIEVSKIKVSLVLESKEGTPIATLLPVAVNTTNEVHSFSFDKTAIEKTGANVKELENVVAFSIRIDRAGVVESHKFTAQQYSALSDLIQR